MLVFDPKNTPMTSHIEMDVWDEDPEEDKTTGRYSQNILLINARISRPIDFTGEDIVKTEKDALSDYEASSRCFMSKLILLLFSLK